MRLYRITFTMSDGSQGHHEARYRDHFAALERARRLFPEARSIHVEVLKHGPKKRRRPATFGRRCIRCWFRHHGKVIRLLHFNDYSPCEAGGAPRLLVKLLTHTRHARGIPLDSASWWGNEVLPHLLPGKWVELVICSEGAAP